MVIEGVVMTGGVDSQQVIILCLDGWLLKTAYYINMEHAVVMWYDVNIQ